VTTAGPGTAGASSRTTDEDRRAGVLAPANLRQAYGCFPSGVVALCGLRADGSPQGMAVSAFGPVSLDPPLVQVCIQTTSATGPALKSVKRLGVSVLAEDQGHVARSLATKTGDRFADVPWESHASGAVFVRGSTLWLETSVETEATAGDHSICLLRVWAIDSRPEVTPLVFHGSRFRLLQPDPPVA
jgi:flavin reductase (DIM6/NTAB) family NADH-FMN oxidoreductase RutF